LFAQSSGAPTNTKIKEYLETKVNGEEPISILQSVVKCQNQIMGKIKALSRQQNGLTEECQNQKVTLRNTNKKSHPLNVFTGRHDLNTSINLK